MTLQSLLHSTITTILSPQRPITPQETDYEIDANDEDPLHSISDRIISQRQQNSNYSTPTRSTVSRATSSRVHGSTMEIHNDYQDDDRDKIRQFVNVKQMLVSLRNLEKLITDPDVNYERFKKTYVESSIGLLDSIQDKRDSQTQQQHMNAEAVSRDLIVKIGLVSVQIFIVLIDLFTPLLIQFTIWWKQILNNDLVQKILNTVVELIFVILTLILDYLKKYQTKTKRKLRKNGTTTKYSRI